MVRSWLLDLTAKALAENPNLDGIAAYVEDSGEGRWTVAEAIDLGVSIPVITPVAGARFRLAESDRSRTNCSPRCDNQFGGHAIKPAE